jgi:uncharacterized membrane protein
MKEIFLYVMIAFYVAAGVNHFWHVASYQQIIPSYLPFSLALIYISGACEIIFALLLIPPGMRPFAAWAIIVLLIGIFPANIQMTINYFNDHNPKAWLTVLRLPLQLVLIWWACLYTKNHVN